ncbi:hypothetical protein [Streptomyces roseoverticillatus]|uniref:Uncharacterized protein n=1 Tax=Streptomyces roseoverticillatus TaxID=66429 RepID=A0ABV3IXS2_9ACTN
MTCVEPDARMARVLRRHCTGMPHVAVEVADFETWRPDRPYGLLYSIRAPDRRGAARRPVTSSLFLARSRA